MPDDLVVTERGMRRIGLAVLDRIIDDATSVPATVVGGDAVSRRTRAEHIWIEAVELAMFPSDEVQFWALVVAGDDPDHARALLAILRRRVASRIQAAIAAGRFAEFSHATRIKATRLVAYGLAYRRRDELAA